MALLTTTAYYLLATCLSLNFGVGKAQTSMLSVTSTGDRPIYTVPAAASEGQTLVPNILDPEAVDPQDVCPGYKASSVSYTVNGLTADLELDGEPCNLYGNDVAHLRLDVEYQASDRLSVRIQPRDIVPGAENETWFILPEELVPRPKADGEGGSSRWDSLLDFKWSNEPTFWFSVTRHQTGDVLFSTEGTVLVYADQFIEFGTAMPENYNLYGLGEVIHGLRLGNNLTRTIYAADVGDPIDANIYGSHPIYLDTRYFAADAASGNLTYVANATTDEGQTYKSFTHGVFLRNAHAQEVLLRESSVTWRALGGTIDLFFYHGPTATDVMRAYQTSTVGLPAMQQYWTLGYHQCRWGYQNWSQLQEVVDHFAEFEIPLETIWSDIDYMLHYRDFTTDPSRFNVDEGAVFLEQLRANNQHYVPIIDSAIYAPNPENASDAYPVYDRGVAADAFMLNPDGSLYIGEVWPGFTVFPDWIGAVLGNSSTFEWWENEVSMWHNQIDFSGIWIDMSEVSSFVVGSYGTGNLGLNPIAPSFKLPGQSGNLVLDYPENFDVTNSTEASSASSAASTQASPTPQSSATVSSSSSFSSTTSTTTYLRTTPTTGVRNINWPPYVINNVQGDLAVHAVSPNATHHGGAVEYDFHNLWGHQILNATYNALLRVFDGKRPFVLGRSTFAGSGKWAAHWGGDNASKWYYMYFSIPQALSFSIFGIPMFGVDTCGFNGNSDMELCARWMQLSAFFPFYRNHNVLSAISQEPYVWAEVTDATKKAMRIRYSLLPYMYTLFARAHQRGDTVMRALAWEFPDDPSLASADRQFMLGSAVLVTPCLVQGATTVDGVFPGSGVNTVWYDWYNQSAVAVGADPGANITIDAPLGHIPVYLRGGSVVPMQEPSMTTYESRQNPWDLIVALDGDEAALGELYLDDGESLEPEKTIWVDFTVQRSILTATPTGTYVDTNPLANVTVLGLKSAPSSVCYNGAELEESSWTYSSASSVLSVTGLGKAAGAGAWSKPWTLSWE